LGYQRRRQGGLEANEIANMTSRILFLFFVLYSISTTAQRVKYHFDIEGKEIKEKEFDKLWRDRDSAYSRWDYETKDSSRVARLIPQYTQGVVNRNQLKEYLEKVTHKKFDKSTIFFICYTYVNDLCSQYSTNNYTKKVIKTLEKLHDNSKAFIEENYPNIVILEFFESGITLENNPNDSTEYYYSDKEDFLRELMFRTPAWCGSQALIKPNGETLVHNGESYIPSRIQLIEDRNWNLFFPKE